MAASITSQGVGKGSFNISGAFDVIRPSVVSNNDYVVILVGVGDDAPVIGGPAGFTSILGIGNAGNDCQSGLFYKKITNAGAESSVYGLTGGATDIICYYTAAVSGLDGTTALDTNSAWAYQENTTSPIATSVVTATDGALVFAAWQTPGTTATPTMPGGSWTTLAQNITEVNNKFSTVYQIFSSAGSTGNTSITGCNAGDDTLAAQFAFRPTGGAPPVIVYGNSTQFLNLLEVGT